jgi:hypothetical protein
MNSSTYHMNIEAFPSYEKAYISIAPLDPLDEDFYEMELPREEKALSSLFRKLKVQSEPNVPVENYASFTREVLTRNVGSCYVPKDNVNSVISHFRHNVPAPDKVPDNNQGVKNYTDLFITESVVLPTDIYVNDKIIKKGTRINFYHEGKL